MISLAPAHSGHTASWVPLTEAQAGLWYAQRLDPGNPIFNTGHCTDIHSPLDLDCFPQAVAQPLYESLALSLRMSDLPACPALWIDPAPRLTLSIHLRHSVAEDTSISLC